MDTSEHPRQNSPRAGRTTPFDLSSAGSTGAGRAGPSADRGAVVGDTGGAAGAAAADSQWAGRAVGAPNGRREQFLGPGCSCLLNKC